MLAVTLYSLGALVASMIGSAIPLARKEWNREQLNWLMAFAAGLFLGVAFLHMIPEAISPQSLVQVDADAARVLAAIGLIVAFVGALAMEHYGMMHSCPEYMEECGVHFLGNPAFFLLFLHSLFDGVAIGAGFKVNPLIGTMTSVAVLIHKFADGFFLVSMMRIWQYPRKRCVRLALLLAAATPIGAALAYSLVLRVAETAIVPVLGFSAGMFIYIGAADSLPRLHRSRNRVALLFFLGGIVLSALARYAITSGV